MSRAEIIIPANDISQHISTAGTEASGTSNMKFVLNGGLILGTVDGANIEITREIGEENIFLFGNLAKDVDELRHRHKYQGTTTNLDANLQEVVDAIDGGMFGDSNIFQSLIQSLRVDWYLIGDDFESYLDAQKLVDEAFRDQDSWHSKTITAVARMGFFSSDRAINEYAEGKQRACCPYFKAKLQGSGRLNPWTITSYNFCFPLGWSFGTEAILNVGMFLFVLLLMWKGQTIRRWSFNY